MTLQPFVYSMSLVLVLGFLTPSCGSKSAKKNSNAEASEAGGDDSADVRPVGSKGNNDGGDSQGSLGSEKSFQAVESQDDLPTCKSSNEDQVVYAKEEEAFFVCLDGDWEEIETRGPKGAKGDPGLDAQTQGLKLYQENRLGIFRIQVTCNKVDPTCNANGVSGGTGSGFLCGVDKVCTNNHVTSCRTVNGCAYELGEVIVHGLKGDRDNLMNGDDPNAKSEEIEFIAPILQKVAPTVTRVPGQDLAIITLDSPQPEANVLKLAKDPFTKSINLLDPILSMSFPLGFTDLYTDVGAVNVKNLADCQNGEYGYLENDPEAGTDVVSCTGRFYHFSTTNDTDKGSSGSPLFNMKTGEVVGVTSAGTEGENANYTWAIDASLFRSEL